jgi:hypothetical protein
MRKQPKLTLFLVKLCLAFTIIILISGCKKENIIDFDYQQDESFFSRGIINATTTVNESSGQEETENKNFNSNYVDIVIKEFKKFDKRKKL